MRSEVRRPRELPRPSNGAWPRGRWGPGTALPPVRRLADDLGVSPGTVATAYKELRRRGIVVTRGRGGTVVAAAPAVASRRPPQGARTGCATWPADTLIPAFLRSWCRPRGSPRGPFASREPRLPGWRRRPGTGSARDGVPAEHVTFAHGALDCIGAAALRGAAARRRGGHGGPRLPPSARSGAGVGAADGAGRVDDEGLRPEALSAALRAGARAVVCSPRAQNPSGGCFSAGRRDALVAVLRESPEVLVVENDHAVGRRGAPLHTLDRGRTGPLGARPHRDQVSGDRPAVGRGACDPTTLARHDGRMLLTSGWVSHLLQETVVGLMTDAGRARWWRRARDSATRGGGARCCGARPARDPAHGVSGMNVWVPVRDESAVVNGLRSQGLVGRGRGAVPDRVGAGRTDHDGGLEPADAGRLASDFAAVLGESEATYGG